MTKAPMTPQLAKSAKMWTQINKPFGSPVQTSVSPTTIPSGDPVMHVGPTVEQGQERKGDFNTGNGGVWPKATGW